MHLRLAAVVWRRKPLALLIAVAVIAAALLVSPRDGEQYEATATVTLFPKTTDVSAAFQDYASNVIGTYAQLVDSQSFLDEVARGLPFSRTGRALKGNVSVGVVPNTTVIKLSARASKPKEAEVEATAVATAFIAAVHENSDVFDARVTDVPTAKKVTPNLLLLAAAAVLAALLAAVAGALLWDRAFGRVRDAAELADATGAPVLGVVPLYRDLVDASHIVVGELPPPGTGKRLRRAAQLEASLRAIRTNLVFGAGGTVRSVAFLPAEPGSGASTVAANVAVAIGELDRTVLLVDANLEHPTLHEIFEIGRGGPALVDAAQRIDDAPDVARETRYPGVRVAVAGDGGSSRRLRAEIFHRVIGRLFGLAEFELVDGEPLATSAEARLLAAAVGAVVLVVRAGDASASRLKSMADDLRVLGVSLIGVVLVGGYGTAEGIVWPSYGVESAGDRAAPAPEPEMPPAGRRDAVEPRIET